MRDVTNSTIISEKEADSSAETTIFSDFMQEVLSLCPEPLAERYRTLQREVHEQDERTLRTLVSPSEQQQMLRTRLWVLLNERLGVPGAERITESELSRGVSNVDYLSVMFKAPYLVAWLLCPVMDYATRVETLVDRAYDRMREILEIPLTDEDGRLDMKAAGLILQVAKMADMRAKGNYTERVESKTLQVNATAKEAHALLGGRDVPTLEEIEARIKQLEGGGQ